MLRRCFMPLAAVSGLAPGAGPTKSNHLYVLRVDDVIPSKYDTLHRLSMELMPKYPGGGKCMGYWTVQIGALNQFISLWQYDHLKHRYDCEKKLAADKEWHRSYQDEIGRLLHRQENMLMKMIYREGNASTMSYKYVMQTSSVKEVELSGPSAILAATFQIVVGEQEGRYVHIIKARNLDDVIPVSSADVCSSKIMGPARWSPAIGCTWR